MTMSQSSMNSMILGKLALLVLSVTTAAAAKKNELRVTSCQQPPPGKGMGRSGGEHRCSVNRTAFNPKFEKGAIIDIDFGPGRRYTCHSQGRIGGSSSSASCTIAVSNATSPGVGVNDNSGGGGIGLFGSSNGNGNGNGNVIRGDMNVITHGKNSRGEDYIFGSTSVNGEICDFSPDANGMNIIVECNPESAYPPEADAVERERGDDATTLFEDGDEMMTNAIQQKETNGSGIRGSLFNQQQKQEHRGLVDDSGSTIDVMVVWTMKAECRKSNLAVGCTNTATTENNMRGLIALAVAETNTAYSLSGVTTQLRLVHAYREPNYVEATSDAFGAALSSITGTTDGVMDDVHTKRNTYGADVVALIIDDAAFCGMAYLGPSVGLMFSVTAWNCATGYYSFGHEIGHNMGCNHDKGTTNACSSSASNYGWRDPSSGFRSILSYNCARNKCDNLPVDGCPRVQRFSNKVNLYNGKAMGSPQHDNASQINSVKATIAAYRTVMIDDTTPQPTNNIQTPLPTKRPTIPPTSLRPTSTPPTIPPTSVRPTNTPTFSPSASPTHSKIPTTTAPSQSPSTMPTIASTPAPISTPSQEITIPDAPSQSPITLMPTTAPTPVPTTIAPTRIPAFTPTLKPTTKAPTGKPTKRKPTVRPTSKKPTAKPI